MKNQTPSVCYWLIEAEGFSFTVIGGPLRRDNKDPRFVWVTAPGGQKRVLRVARANIRITNHKEFQQRLAADKAAADMTQSQFLN